MKIKRLKLSAHLLADFLRHPVPPGITQTGMPADAEILGAWFDPVEKVVTLSIGSRRFPNSGGEIDVRFHQQKV